MRMRHALLAALLVAPFWVRASSLDFRATQTVSRIAFGAHLDQEQQQPVWAAVIEAEADLFVFAGDNICVVDESDASLLHGAYSALRQHDGFARVAADVPIIGTWNRSDTARLRATSTEIHGRLARNAFLSFFNGQTDINQAFIFGTPGRRVQIILLDVRSFRNERTRQLLGTSQWSWLREQLRRQAELRIVVSSLQVLPPEPGFDRWSAHARERRLLFDMISDAGAEHVVFVSADRSHAELSMLPSAVHYPLYELTVGSLNQHHAALHAEELNTSRISDTCTDPCFGLIEVDWESPDPAVTFEIRDANSRTRLVHRADINDLGSGEASMQGAQ